MDKVKSNKVSVVAAGNPVPMESNSRRYIGKEPVSIELTSYYRRRLATGELVEAKKSPASKAEVK